MFSGLEYKTNKLDSDEVLSIAHKVPPTSLFIAAVCSNIGFSIRYKIIKHLGRKHMTFPKLI